MAKKKKNKKKNDSILKEVDQSLDQTYQQLIDEIRSMQLRIEIADKLLSIQIDIGTATYLLNSF